MVQNAKPKTVSHSTNFSQDQALFHITVNKAVQDQALFGVTRSRITSRATTNKFCLRDEALISNHIQRVLFKTKDSFRIIFNKVLFKINHKTDINFNQLK